VTGETITAGAAGTWTLGDPTVNRIGLGAMRLTRNADGTPIDRDRAVTVLRQQALRRHVRSTGVLSPEIRERHADMMSMLRTATRDGFRRNDVRRSQIPEPASAFRHSPGQSRARFAPSHQVPIMCIM
jgi:hypothetical protein